MTEYFTRQAIGEYVAAYGIFGSREDDIFGVGRNPDACILRLFEILEWASFIETKNEEEKGTYTLTNVTAAFRYSLLAGLQRLTRESNSHGTAMAASGVGLAAFYAGWHASFVSWREILRIELGIEDAVIEIVSFIKYAIFRHDDTFIFYLLSSSYLMDSDVSNGACLFV